MKKTIALVALIASTVAAQASDPIAELINDRAISKETQCLIDNVFHEARGESLKGQIMVASVTLSRVDDPRWPNTICEVVYQHRQFSWTLLSKKRNLPSVYGADKQLTTRSQTTYSSGSSTTQCRALISITTLGTKLTTIGHRRCRQ